MRKLLLYLLDVLIRWRNWYVDRRDTIARLQAYIERQSIRHQQETERLRGEIQLRDEQIKTLTAICVKHRAHIEAETAILARMRVDAEASAKPIG